MQIKVSTPYRENSIVNIAAIAAKNGVLSEFYTTLYFAKWQKYALCLPFIGKKLGKELGRRAFNDIPADCISNVATIPEILRVFFRRLLSNRSTVMSSNFMYTVKKKFDEEVAKQLQLDADIVFIGMYGSSLESFSRVREKGGISVLNFVNSHPKVHNQYLHEMAGLISPHHELMPQWFVERVEKEIELADLILVPSRFVEEQLKSRGVSANKISVIPYGVNLNAFCPRGKKKSEAVVECLYVGQISHRKGISFLFDAARKCLHLDIYFRLIGPLVSQELLEGMPENVIYEGAVAPDEMVSAMQKADVFVLPTLEDSYALVVLEAMASGLAVITTNSAGASEMITNGVDGIVVPSGNSDALAQAIHTLVLDNSLRERLSQEALNTVHNGSCSWGAYGDKVLDSISRKYKSNT